MSYKISKELVEAVMDGNLLRLDDDGYMEFSDNEGRVIDFYTNDFFFKCKEWAYSLGYVVTSGNNHLIYNSCSIRRAMSDDDWKDFYADSEQQSVFDACTQILEWTKEDKQ